LPPSSDVRHQNATQRRRHATTEFASVERCSRENAWETPLHADKPHGGEGAADAFEVAHFRPVGNPTDPASVEIRFDN
jgi:hypothetical protein